MRFFMIFIFLYEYGCFKPRECFEKHPGVNTELNQPIFISNGPTAAQFETIFIESPNFTLSIRPWDHGTMGPWDHGTMGPWDRGTMGPWDCSRNRLTFLVRTCSNDHIDRLKTGSSCNHKHSSCNHWDNCYLSHHCDLMLISSSGLEVSVFAIR